MNTVMTQQYNREFFKQSVALQFGWLWKGVWVALLLSVFALVYMNFSIRVDTIKLNNARQYHQALITKKDQLMLEVEGLQTRRHTERMAAHQHNYYFAKGSKVKQVTVH